MLLLVAGPIAKQPASILKKYKGITAGQFLLEI